MSSEQACTQDVSLWLVNNFELKAAEFLKTQEILLSLT